MTYLIGENGYGGGITDLTAWRDACEVHIKGKAFDPKFPHHHVIAPGRCGLVYVDDGTSQLEAVFGQDEDKYDVLFQMGGVNKWRGFVQPAELENILYTPGESRIVAVDRLGILDGIPYVKPTDQSDYTGNETYIKIIAQCLAYTGLGLGISTHNYWYPRTGSNDLTINDDPFAGIVCDQVQFYDANQNPFSLRFVLEQILDLHLCTLYQWNEKWIISQRKRKDEGGGVYRVFNYKSDGTADTPATSNLTLRRTVAIASGYTFDKPPSRKGTPAIAEASCFYRHGNPFESAFGNLSFEEALSTTTDIGNWKTIGTGTVTNPDHFPVEDDNAISRSFPTRYIVGPIGNADYVVGIEQKSAVPVTGGANNRIFLSWYMKLLAAATGTGIEFAYDVIVEGAQTWYWNGSAWTTTDPGHVRVTLHEKQHFHQAWGEFQVSTAAMLDGATPITGNVRVRIWQAIELDTGGGQKNFVHLVDSFSMGVIVSDAPANEATHYQRAVKGKTSGHKMAVRDFVIGDGPTDTHVSATALKSGGTPADWFNASWLRRWKVTFNSALVPSDQTNFDWYIDLSKFAGVNDSGGNDMFVNARADGGDIRLTDGDGTTELPTELRDFNQGAKTGRLYFKHPNMTSAANASAYLYVANAAATRPADGDANGAHNVYRSEYKFVTHHDETPGPTPQTISDSTSNNNDGQAINMDAADLIAGNAGSAHDFDGVNDHIKVPHHASLDLDTSGTITIDINFTSASSFDAVFGKRQDDLAVRQNYGLNYSTTANLQLFFWSNGAYRVHGVDWATNFVFGTWYRLDLVLKEVGANVESIIYKNGVVIGTKTHTTQQLETNTAALYLAGAGLDATTVHKNSPIKLDEFKVYNGEKPADYIKASYENYYNATFVTVGAAEELTTALNKGNATKNWSYGVIPFDSGLNIFQFRNNQLVKENRNAQRLISCRLAAVGANIVEPTHYMQIERPDGVTLDDYTWSEIKIYPDSAGVNAIADLEQFTDGVDSNAECVIGIKPNTTLASSLGQLVGLPCDVVTDSTINSGPDTLYLADSTGRIRKATIDPLATGWPVTTITTIAAGRTISELKVDQAAGWIFTIEIVTAGNTYKLVRRKLDGTGAIDLLTFTASQFIGNFTLSRKLARVYIGVNGTTLPPHNLVEYDYNSTLLRTIKTEAVSGTMFHLAVDPNGTDIFWMSQEQDDLFKRNLTTLAETTINANVSEDPNSLGTAYLSGSIYRRVAGKILGIDVVTGVENTVDTYAHVSDEGLAVDILREKIYWGETSGVNTSDVHEISANGTGERTVISLADGGTHFVAMDTGFD